MEFFLRGVEESALESMAQAEALIALRERWHERFQSARSSALLLKLVDQLFKSPSITFGQAAKLLKVTDVTASSNVRKLVEAGILTERTGRKWGQVFVAMEIIALIGRRSRGKRS